MVIEIKTTTQEHPIIFSGPMVRAILSGQKTQTRRIIKPQPDRYIDSLHGDNFRGRAPYDCEDEATGCYIGYGFQDDSGRFTRCPYGKPGDRLWVREAWCPMPSHRPIPCPEKYDDKLAWYRADGDRPTWAEQRWKPSIHMPRWASRLTINIKRVRVEQLQDISEADAIAEGCAYTGDLSARQRFELLWTEINGPESWPQNPWVWVIEW